MFRKRLPSQLHAKGVEKAHQRQKGFTLIEMLAVVIILVIVAAIGFVVVNNQIEKSRLNTDKANVRTIADAVQRYVMDKSAAPNNVDALVGEYLAKKPEDPWNKGDEYKIEVNTQTGDITVKGIKSENDIKLEGALK